MTDLFTLLDDTEIDRLDRFLLERIDIDEEADTTGMDEGILDISGLDGLLTAVVSGPVTVQPSQWLPAVWGDFEPEWDSEQDFMDIFSLMMRHMNGIAGILMEDPEDFEPLFGERQVEGRSWLVVDEWCEGYLNGLMPEAAWETGGEEMTRLLAPILAFTSASDWRGHDFADEEMESLQNAIAPNVREIHAFWLARRKDFMPATETVRRGEPRTGRNDPCPCGSGRKYKKCCLQ